MSGSGAVDRFGAQSDGNDAIAEGLTELTETDDTAETPSFQPTEEDDQNIQSVAGTDPWKLHDLMDGN